MPIPTSIADISTTAASNYPAGGDAIGTSLDDYLRTIQSIIKQQDSKGSDIASSTTITAPNAGSYFVVTGTTTIATIADNWNGRQIALKFSGVLQLTHSTGLILPGAANITTAAGDCLLAVNESTGVWRVVAFQRASGAALSSGVVAADVQTQSATRFTAGGTADAITGTLSPAITAYAAGLRVTTTVASANTITTPTLNLNGLGAKTIKKHASSGTPAALATGDYNASGPAVLEYDGTDFILLNPIPSSAASSVQIQPISAAVGSNALTISAAALSLDFRSGTLTSGTVTTVSGDPADLVISSGSTLGTVSGVQSRIAVLAINNAGTIELAVVNIAGGNDLSETGVISTTAEGGAGAADSANVIYSTTARTGVAYRVIGYVESTQATAGTWATAPSTIQGAGGNAMQGLMTIGHGQAWQNVIGSRSSGTTYYNTTGRPICVCVAGATTTATITVVVNGVTLFVAWTAGAYGSSGQSTFIVPPGASYSVAFSSGGPSQWAELR